MVSIQTIQHILNNSRIGIDSTGYPRCDLDSHDDTCLAGDNFIMHSRTGETVSIYGFDDDAPPVSNVPVGTCMTAYTLETGETVILIVHQALYLGKRHQGSLLCPNQMRQHGVRVDDCPVHLSMGMNSTHSIILQEDDVTIPLQLDGTISYFNSHIPTKRAAGMPPCGTHIINNLGS